ncbi:MAG: NADPH-dependent 7-cyano-7-deazaguanine reductase QueF [Gammaproteobacteria bacterium RIFCSPHIGHO2_12_FULL_43_28]|nr:MAG: NADPH-dependent 7-cyano-7-deazaguanine reductase QueF [Gammaproteobacteria bacterium RIFCSPHIGHO2_12_FULL_43_28]
MPVSKEVSKPEQSELGKKSAYDPVYNPEKLFPIPRKLKRDEIGVPDESPFFGYDLWNHYEVSWLNQKGKPVVALAEIIYACDTPNIIESKSMKLYFNSLNSSPFKDADTVRAVIEKDIAERVGGTVFVTLFPLPLKNKLNLLMGFDGICIDEADIECTVYEVNASFLSVDNETVDEALYSDLLKSNCLVTSQPDWGSVQIAYKGRKINREGLLRYIVSFRNHNEFHEQCIERIFMDIMRRCQPEELTVYGRYTRRGGLDINPYRSTNPIDMKAKNNRLCRQ